MGSMQTVLITGASSGIGAALAETAARRGLGVALLARREDRLEEVAARCRSHGVPTYVARCDVACRDQVEEAYGGATEALGPIDTVICNAATSEAGIACLVDPAAVQRVLEVNLFGALHLLQVAAPTLHGRSGRLAMIGSLSSYTPASGMAAYVVSKHALLGLARTAALEAAATGSTMSVTFVAPGAIDTDLLRVDPALLPEGLSLARGDRLNAWMSAEQAAREILVAVERRVPEVTITWQGRLLNRLYPWSPRLWSMAAAYLYGFRRAAG
jgi:short-subunit dehydrogenase